MNNKALKVEFEGCDGSGKTTALKYFIKKLESAGKTVLETREVGSPLIPINVKLREVVLAPESNLSGEAMEFIFAAMRIENDRLYKTVTDKDFIVSDRGFLSHLAYTDHNVNKEFTDSLYMNLVKNITDLPDVVVYFKVNTETALKRRVSRGEGMDVIEMKGIEYQELVRGSFEEHIEGMGQYSPETRFFIIDANDTLEGVQAQLDKVITELTI